MSFGVWNGLFSATEVISLLFLTKKYTSLLTTIYKKMKDNKTKNNILRNQNKNVQIDRFPNYKFSSFHSPI